MKQGRAALGEGQQVGGEGVGRRGVEVLGRLVEHEDGEVGQQGAGHRDPLALPAREAGARRSRPGWPGRRAARPASRPGRPGPARGASSSSVAERRPTRRFSARVVSKRCGLCSTSPTTRRTSSAARRSSGTPSRVASPPSAGRKRTRTSASVDLPAPLGPTRATRRPGRQVEVHPAQRPAGRCRGSEAHTDAQAERVRSGHRAGQRQWGARVVDRCRGVRGGEHPARRRARALQRLGGRRQWGHQLEGGQRDEGQHGQQRAVEMAAVGGVHPEGQGAPAGQPGQCGGQAEPDAGRARALAGRRPQPAIGPASIRSSCSPVPPMTISSGAPSMRSTTAAPRARPGPTPAWTPPAGPGDPSARAPPWPRPRGPPAARRRRRGGATT